MSRTILLTAALATTLLLSCNGKDSPVSKPASASAPAPSKGANDGAALRKLEDLQAQSVRAAEDKDHGRLSKIVEAAERLEFRTPENARRRDELVKGLRTQAVTLRDALHRFLFVELGDIPPAQRGQLLQAADRGDADALANAAGALAEHQFQAGQAYLRATPALKAGAADPLTKLPVRPAGDVKMLWQRSFNEAFNARMRELIGQARPPG